MADRKSFVLVDDARRQNAIAAVIDAALWSRVTIAAPQRSVDQNSKLHAILSDLANSQVQWFGKRRDADEWKVLMISAHAVATDGRGEVIPGIEGEMVAIRESSASMSVARAASLITYVLAFCDMNGVQLNETKAAGFFDLPDREAAA